MVKTRRLAFSLFYEICFICFLLGFVLGCSDEKNISYNKTGRAALLAPLSKDEISNIVVPGMRKEDLLQRCGKSRVVRRINGCEEIEFFISSERLKPKSDKYIGSFIVTLTNDFVLSWRPNSMVRIR